MLGNEAHFGHSGDGVDFEEEDLFAADNVVDSYHSAATQVAVYFVGEIYDSFAEFYRDVCRADLLRGSQIFGLVVKEFVIGYDFGYRQTNQLAVVLVHSVSHLPAINKLLNQNSGILLKGALNCVVKLLQLLYLGYPKAASAIVWLNKERKAQSY